MRVVSYNILNGGVGRADPIGEVIEAQRSDIVVLVEADDAWVVQRIARRLNMDYAVGHGPRHAAAILSRHPIVHSINRATLDTAGPRSWLEARIEPHDAAPLHVVAIHLHARATPADEAVRVVQIGRVLAATAAWRDAGVPHLLAGDFNADAPGQRVDPARCKAATRQAIADNAGRLPRDAVALLLAHGYTDTLAATRGDAAFDAATFTTHEPGQRVDYVFTHGLAAIEGWVETDRLATYASDHYPVGVDLHDVAPAGRSA